MTIDSTDSGRGADTTPADRIDALWAGHDRVVTEDDLKDGKIAEVYRWCRDRLGGGDQDLVGPLRWGEASNQGWSARATYSCLPGWGSGKKWRAYLHDWSRYVYLMLPAAGTGGRNPDGPSPVQARLELELVELVVGWFIDEAQGTRRRFPPLHLSSPPDLRYA